MLILANIVGFVSLYWRYFATGLAVLVLVASVVLWSYCGKSRIEKRIEDRQPVIVEQQTGANQAVNAAVNANAQAEKLQANANAIRANKQTNVSLSEAERNRCIAYPESCK